MGVHIDLRCFLEGGGLSLFEAPFLRGDFNEGFVRRFQGVGFSIFFSVDLTLRSSKFIPV